MALAAVALSAGVALGGSSGDKPTITGTAQEGETLTSSEADLYRWQRCDPSAATCADDAGSDDPNWTDVPGANGPNQQTYVLTTADIGRKIRVQTKLTDTGTQFVPSDPVGPVLRAAPVNQTPPSISGSATEGETLSGDDGAWQSSVPLTFARQWQRSTGGGFADIPGATGADYTLAAADVGHTIRLQVTASNSEGGSATAHSEPTAEVAPAGPPPPIVHESANIKPVGDGGIYVLFPGADGFVLVTDPTQIPLGSIVDVTDGTVRLITARNARGVLQSARFWAGRFYVTQTPGKSPVTLLRLVGGGQSSASSSAASREPVASASRRRGKRRLWGKGKCRCRTRGRHASGTVRGTKWLTLDRPGATVIRVRRGKVVVRDFALDKKIRVKAPDRYVARSRDRRR